MFGKEINEHQEKNGWTLVPTWLEEGEPDRFDLSTGEITLFIPDKEQNRSCESGFRKGQSLVVDTTRVVLVDTQVKPVWSYDMKQGYEANGFTVVLFEPKRIVAVKTLA